MLKKLTGIGKKEKKRVSIQEEHTVFTESNTKRRVIPPETTPQLSNGNGVANGRSVPIVRTDKLYRNGTLADNTDSEVNDSSNIKCFLPYNHSPPLHFLLTRAALILK